MTSATVTSGGYTNTYTYTYAGADQKAVLSETGGGHSYKLTYGRADPQGNPEVVGYNVDGTQAYVEDDANTGQANMLHTSSDIACAYVYDGTGSPVALLTDFNTTAFTYKYDPYGVPTLTSGGGGNGAKQNPYSFKSGVWDRATGLVKYGLRWYDPTTGRWTQQDTLDNPLDPANANRYAYAGDDPINLIDPSGADIQGCLAGLGSGIVSFATLETIFGSAALAEAVSAGTLTVPLAVGLGLGFAGIYLAAWSVGVDC